MYIKTRNVYRGVPVEREVPLALPNPSQPSHNQWWKAQRQKRKITKKNSSLVTLVWISLRLPLLLFKERQARRGASYRRKGCGKRAKKRKAFFESAPHTRRRGEQIWVFLALVLYHVLFVYVWAGRINLNQSLVSVTPCHYTSAFVRFSRCRWEGKKHRFLVKFCNF